MTKLICIDNEHRDDQLTLNRLYYYNGGDGEFEFLLRHAPDEIIEIENDINDVEGYFVSRFKLFRQCILPNNIRIL